MLLILLFISCFFVEPCSEKSCMSRWAPLDVANVQSRSRPPFSHLRFDRPNPSMNAPLCPTNGSHCFNPGCFVVLEAARAATCVDATRGSSALRGSALEAARARTGAVVMRPRSGPGGIGMRPKGPNRCVGGGMTKKKNRLCVVCCLLLLDVVRCLLFVRTVVLCVVC